MNTKIRTENCADAEDELFSFDWVCPQTFLQKFWILHATFFLIPVFNLETATLPPKPSSFNYTRTRSISHLMGEEAKFFAKSVSARVYTHPLPQLSLFKPSKQNPEVLISQ